MSARSGLALALLLLGISGPTAYAVTEDDKITATDAAAFDRFGNSVAVSGSTVVVGAPLDDDGGIQSGSAYVFDCSSFPCVQVTKLIASDAAALDQFGHAVGVSGTAAVVGAPLEDAAGGDTGSAYYYDLSACGAACTEAGKLTPSDPGLTDLFGSSVAVSGTTAVIGAHLDDDDGNQSGSAYYFDLSTCGAVCNESAKLTATDAAAFDRFGTSVGLDGSNVVVGALNNGGSGSAYVFDCSSLACAQVSKLTASDAAADDQFGLSLGVSGSIAVVGADRDDDAGDASGSAYYFDLRACGAACNETGKLTVSDATAVRQLGFSVGISGTTTVVSAVADLNDDPGVASGVAYSFDLSTCGAACNETSKLIPSDAAASDEDEFGWSVAVSEITAVVGARFDDDAGPRSGSAYVYELDVVDPDNDDDGVPDLDDACNETVIPEGVPTVRLGTNRFALVDDDSVFDNTTSSGAGPGLSFTIEDTAGCSCEQIIADLGLGQGHVKFGCSISAMEGWVALVSP